jgi:hypothetical protein
MHIRLRFWLAGRRDRVNFWVCRHLPDHLVFWALIRAGAREIHGGEVVPEVTFTTVLKRAGDRARIGRAR